MFMAFAQISITCKTIRIAICATIVTGFHFDRYQGESLSRRTDLLPLFFLTLKLGGETENQENRIYLSWSNTIAPSFTSLLDLSTSPTRKKQSKINIP